jgi:septal ring factor EnvC (AmiA/AmiB activator)
MTTINQHTHETLFYSIGAHIHAIKESLDKTSKRSIDTNTSLKSQQEKIDTLDLKLNSIERDLKALPRIEGMLRKLTMTEEEIKREEYLDAPLSEYINAREQSEFDPITVNWFYYETRTKGFTIRDLLDNYSYIMEKGNLFSWLKKYSYQIGPKKASIIVKDFKKMAKKAGRVCN